MKRNLNYLQVSIMCTDLVFGSFICPVIVNPELYGITELFMSDIAQFNLMQVAQIVQRLAMLQWQETDVKLSAIFSKFDKNCLWFVMEEILEGNLIEDDDAMKPGNLSALSRTAVVISENELQNLVRMIKASKYRSFLILDKFQLQVSVLKSVSAASPEEVDVKALTAILAHLPSKSLNALGKHNRLSCQNQPLMQLSPPNTPQKSNFSSPNPLSFM
jgi:hypothetical protein